MVQEGIVAIDNQPALVYPNYGDSNPETGLRAMIPNSLRTRGVLFAFLFGPPRFIEREEAARVHGKVCDHLKHDDFVFRYSASGTPDKPQSRGFSISFQRKEGQGSFTTAIDLNNVNSPVRVHT